MARRLLPLLDRVLVEKIAAPAKTNTGILLPESAVKQISEGVVRAVGPGRLTESGQSIPVDLKEGDIVVLPEFGGTPINFDGQEVQIFRADELLAKVES
eukprot:g9190.t1